MEAWFKDLAGNKQLSYLGKKVKETAELYIKTQSIVQAY